MDAKTWEDTVITPEQIDKVEQVFNYEELATHQVVDAYLKAQAKVTWEARDPEIAKAHEEGMKEVVKWIETHIADAFPYAKEEWQAFLKSKGIGQADKDEFDRLNEISS